ncbi:MAG: beta-lactamase family protein, partial [Gemmatimonadetes bacterium]|nr:beta-lactamase family protein [Gemmatimonadota bacterium]
MSRFLPALLASALLVEGCASSQAGAPSSVAAAPASVVTATAKARIDSTLRAYVASGRLVGVSAVVWEKGAERYYGAYGVADREAGRPMQRDAIVQIYSMTKPITGVALMTLYEQGKFKLDDPLAKYLPEF